MKILMTGAAGKVGTTLVNGLRDRHTIRGFDLRHTPELDDSIVGNVSDLDAVLAAMEGMDAVIHLGAIPGGAGLWEDILPSNFVGTYNIFEAARQCEVRRVAFASRAGLLGPYPREVQRTVEMLPRPTSYYSVSKAYGESLGYMYSERFEMEIVCVRIGNFNADRDQPEHPHHLSHGDAVRVFEQAVTHPGVRFEIVFGVSNSNWPLYDVDHGRNAIGYHPQDFSEVPENERG
jgi:uronate dehydrogenase